ncbi:MAG: hypothetical protein B7Y25_03860 [Alphaproteobacteria bacterium 16-39-46]|nr:MAG: hypothetical protein B7Y25_03860 [Alphaproteobacteria bacterium 16-39-46]OZA43293.1 MAG: hypothetical protein B7X84_03695 [Alphaproteobacteria bacterium 17-39-52]
MHHLSFLNKLICDVKNRKTSSLFKGFQSTPHFHISNERKKSRFLKKLLFSPSYIQGEILCPKSCF